jgi:hypothetical protein
VVSGWGRWCATHQRAAGIGRRRKAAGGSLHRGRAVSGFKRNFREYLIVKDFCYKGQGGTANFFRQDMLGNQNGPAMARIPA